MCVCACVGMCVSCAYVGVCVVCICRCVCRCLDVCICVHHFYITRKQIILIYMENMGVGGGVVCMGYGGGIQSTNIPSLTCARLSEQ